jgi:holo-[acyl-carrier protein] synthase
MKIGTDIVQIRRIESAIARHGEKFIDRFLSTEEQKRLSRKPESLAGYWAAKEALAKALGCGIGHELAFHDIVLNKTDRGAPLCSLRASAQEYFRIASCSLSISHDGGYALAIVALTLLDS